MYSTTNPFYLFQRIEEEIVCHSQQLVEYMENLDVIITRLIERGQLIDGPVCGHGDADEGTLNPDISRQPRTPSVTVLSGGTTPSPVGAGKRRQLPWLLQLDAFTLLLPVGRCTIGTLLLSLLPLFFIFFYYKNQ